MTGDGDLSIVVDTLCSFYISLSLCTFLFNISLHYLWYTPLPSYVTFLHEYAAISSHIVVSSVSFPPFLPISYLWSMDTFNTARGRPLKICINVIMACIDTLYGSSTFLSKKYWHSMSTRRIAAAISPATIGKSKSHISCHCEPTYVRPRPTMAPDFRETAERRERAIEKSWTHKITRHHVKRVSQEWETRLILNRPFLLPLHKFMAP